MDLIVPMIIGAVIGYLDHWLVVKMIFWPRHTWRVFGVRVPFTPGVFARRRRDFSREVASLVQDRLLSGEGLFDAVYTAFSDGSADRILGRYPLMRVAVGLYFDSLTKDQFLADCQRAAGEAREAKIASIMITSAIDSMSIDEIENMVISIINRELRVIIWLGAPIGAAVGAAQVLLK